MSDAGDNYLIFLKERGCDLGVIAHCVVVRDVAGQITDKILSAGKVSVDRNLVAAGAILHDIGRSVSHGMDHADIGGSVCRELGLCDSVCRIVERHIGAGLSGEERISFGLVGEDRIPETIEEKIVAHADNLVKGTKIITRDELNRSIQKFPKFVQQRFMLLADELEDAAGSSLP